MGLARSLRAVVGQFSGARDDYEDYDDDDAFAGLLECESGDEAPQRRRGGSADYDEIYRDESPARPREARDRAVRPLAIVRPPHVEFCLVVPQDFDDAQQIADRLRAGGPVIVDLQGCEAELAKRVIDFCSGLTYALEGSLEYLGEKVVLLTPHNVELSSQAPGGLHERRFFNQV